MSNCAINSGVRTVRERGASSADISPNRDEVGRDVGKTSPESANADSVAINASSSITEPSSVVCWANPNTAPSHKVTKAISGEEMEN